MTYFEPWPASNHDNGALAMLVNAFRQYRDGVSRWSIEMEYRGWNIEHCSTGDIKRQNPDYK